MLWQRWAKRRSNKRDNGAVLVEAALALPILATLAFGVLEFGTLISEHHDMSSAVRSAVRVASTSGPSLTADHDILQAMRDSQTTKNSDSLNKIVIYKANDSAGQPTGACAQAQPVVGQCNVYLASDIGMSDAQLALTGRGLSWPSSTRVSGSDYIGVYATADHHWITHLFSNGGTQVSEDAVMRIDPDTVQPWVPPDGMANPTTTTSTSTTTTTTKKSTTTTSQKPTTTTSQKPATTTTTQKQTTTTTTTSKPATTTTQKPTTTTTTAKPTTTTTKAPATTTTTAKPQYNF